MAVKVFLATLVAALFVWVATAGASDVRHRPFHIRRASLTQDGQDLIWHVVLGHPFSPDGLKSTRRSLCLQLEHPKRRTAFAVLCLGPGRRGKNMRLNYMKVTRRGRGHARVIHALLSRGSTSSLTAQFLPAEAGLAYGPPVRWQVLTTLRPPACHPKTHNPLGCTSIYPAKAALTRLHTPRLVSCVPSGSSYVTSVPTNRKVVALTFDDGPWPDTPQFLDILERDHVHATFFQIGEQVSTYGQSVDARMLRDGDMIGDHTWNHANVSGAGSFAPWEISRTAAAIRDMTGFTPCLFRAPGGAVSGALISEARSMGFTTIEWSVDPRDWARPGTGAIYSTVVNGARPGAIILQHDGGGDRSETLAALPQEIATLKSRGYQFETVTQLLGQRLIYK